MIADMFAVRDEIDIFRYEEPESPAKPTLPVAPKPKAPKPPKPAPVPPPVLSKPNELGFHESTIKRALETWQPKGSPQQLLKHLEGHQGAKHEAELTGLHDFLKDKPSVSREDVLKHLETHPHQVRMEEHDQASKPGKWRVVGDDGYGDDVFDSEEEAQEHADYLNQEARDDHAREFKIEGGEGTHTVNTDLLEELEEKETELGGKMTMEASRALQRLASYDFETRGEAEDAINEYIRNHLPKLYESDSLGVWTDDDPMISSNPGGYTVSDSPLSRWRHQQHFGDTYDSEEEAQQAIDVYLDNYFENPYSPVEREGDERETYEDYTLKGPRENYNETHVAMPGIREPRKELITAAGLSAEFVSQGGNGDSFFRIMKNGDKIADHWMTANTDPVIAVDDFVKKQNAQKPPQLRWSDGHGNYSHINNPVVRIRHDDRETTDGKSMFFVEEIQGPSDTNQAKMPKWVQDRIYDIGLKRALTKAVQGGHDKMGWTTGAHQQDRYNLRKVVDRIEWHPAAPNVPAARLLAYKNGQLKHEEFVEKDALPEYVGKEVAAKMLASPTNSVEGPDLEVGGRGLKDLYDRELHKRLMEIKIGDKKLKNMGVKIGTSEVATDDPKPPAIERHGGGWGVLDGNGEFIAEFPLHAEAIEYANQNKHSLTVAPSDTVHSIDITPELAAEIKKHGVSLYRRRGEPDRYSRDFMDVIRRMPSREAAGVAAEMLRLMDLRPEYMRMFSTEELSFLRSLIGLIGLRSQQRS